MTAAPHASTAGVRSRGFTLRARVLLVLGVVTGLAAFVAQERELLMIAGFCLGAPTVAALWVSLRRTQVRGELLARPPAIEVGSDGDLLLTLRSRGHLPVPVSRIVNPVLPSGAPVEFLGGDRGEPPLHRGAARLVELPFRGRGRGKALIPSPVVRLADPFGLWFEDHTPADPAPVLVLPLVVPLEGLPLGIDRRRPRRPTDLGGEPDVVVRPYVAGDDIRTIHWRASARLEDDLVVRLREAGSARSVALVLDDRPRAHSGHGLEVAVALAASIALRIRDASLALSVSDAAGQVLVDGEEDPERLLLALALVGDRDTPARGFTPEIPGRPELVIAVVGQGTHGGSGPWLRGLAHGVSGIAFCVGGPVPGLPTGWQSVPVQVPGGTGAAGGPPSRDELGRAVVQAWRAVSSPSGRGRP
ncbi:DUF58 domain-containing protein [Salana multivorans]